MKRRKILVFTGAGVSSESGIATFRDSKDGLWNNFNVDEVATISGWKSNPQKVIDFYNLRRKDMESVTPNRAHDIISDLSNNFDVTVVTQNVDSLHEKAGSTKVIHLHGEISNLKSEINDNFKIPFEKDLEIGDVCPEGGQLRPDIVWFGEDLDINKIEEVKKVAIDCDVCIIVGTSMQVSPANTIPWMTKETALIYYIDPSPVDFYIPTYRKSFFYHIQQKASIGMDEVNKDLEEIYL